MHPRREETASGASATPRRARRSSEHWILLGLALVGLAALVLAGFVLEPDPRGYGTHEQLGLLPCYPMEVWGIPCPGCGVTTSVAHLVRGELVASLRVQPLGALLGVGAVVFALWSGAGHARGRDLWAELNRLRLGAWMAAGALALVAAWLYKTAAVRGWPG